jgi:hypothetical protein
MVEFLHKSIAKLFVFQRSADFVFKIQTERAWIGVEGLGCGGRMFCIQ